MLVWLRFSWCLCGHELEVSLGSLGLSVSVSAQSLFIQSGWEYTWSLFANWFFGLPVVSILVILGVCLWALFWSDWISA